MQQFCKGGRANLGYLKNGGALEKNVIGNFKGGQMPPPPLPDKIIRYIVMGTIF